MTTDDLFTTPAKTNVPELSVSELAFSLKRTLEETYGRVRVRGELSGLKIAGSGHLYGDIKDADSVINIVCWKSSLARFSVTPEDGMEVVVTGKVTSYPKNSRYQLVVDQLALAGQGALLKLLEDRRKKLAAEGLFDPAGKKPIPFLPTRIGVVTSPTGAVIRDILHRLSERCPVPVLLWPVLVQGDGAAAQIAQAIDGFNALPSEQRPDVLIVARGGGALEDLMPFNEENVVRAAARSKIPLISAIGHETDTTLIDYAADKRAPTPTGAAEMAVPVRLDLLMGLSQSGGRLFTALRRSWGEKAKTVSLLSARLGDPLRLLEVRAQMLDHLHDKLTHEFSARLAKIETRLAGLNPRHPDHLVLQRANLLTLLSAPLQRAIVRGMEGYENTLAARARLLESLSFKGVLQRGFAVVRDANGAIITDGVEAGKTPHMTLQFRDDILVKVQKT